MRFHVTLQKDSFEVARLVFRPPPHDLHSTFPIAVVCLAAAGRFSIV